MSDKQLIEKCEMLNILSIEIMAELKARENKPKRAKKIDDSELIKAQFRAKIRARQ